MSSLRRQKFCGMKQIGNYPMESLDREREGRGTSLHFNYLSLHSSKSKGGIVLVNQEWGWFRRNKTMDDGSQHKVSDEQLITGFLLEGRRCAENISTPSRNYVNDNEYRVMKVIRK